MAAATKKAPAKAVTPKPVQVGRPSAYTETLERFAELKAGVWRVVRTYDSATGAKDALHRFRNKTRKVPAGSWEFKAEHDRDTNTSQLLVRYMGDDENIVRWWRGGELVERVPPKERKAKKAGAKKRWTDTEK